MRVWRICKAEHAARAFTGEGALLYAGRWHRKGTPVVYASESRALAALEQLVNLHRNQLPPRLVCFGVDIPDALRVTEVRIADLPARWHRHPAPVALQEIGSRWAEQGRSACMKLPSAVIRGEFNFLLNPRHADFSRLEIGRHAPFEFDPRLFVRT